MLLTLYIYLTLNLTQSEVQPKTAANFCVSLIQSLILNILDCEPLLILSGANQFLRAPLNCIDF